MTRLLAVVFIGVGILLGVVLIVALNALAPHLKRRSLHWSWNRPPARHRADKPVRHPVRDRFPRLSDGERMRRAAVAATQARLAVSRLPFLPGQRRPAEQEATR